MPKHRDTVLQIRNDRSYTTGIDTRSVPIDDPRTMRKCK